MGGFIGIRWAPAQLRCDLTSRERSVEGVDGKVHAVSRSVHYGLFLAFEGIRFTVQEHGGRLQFTFVNLDLNLARFRRSMLYNLSESRAGVVPSPDELRGLFLQFLSLPENRSLFQEMAHKGEQGYLRPFTVDEDQSIGVTFPQRPNIRVVGAAYQDYMGEPFDGVVIPGLVRAPAHNGTGALKLGVNYLMSVKAVQRAQKVLPGAQAALFLDDRPYEPLDGRKITEWDSSCAFFGMADGTYVRIPDSPLILPSVTIRALVDLLRNEGATVVERDMTYGELRERARAGEIATVCAVGTAGVLNRVRELHLFDGAEVEAVIRADTSSEVYSALSRVKARYLDVFHHRAEPVGRMHREVLEAL